MSTRQEIESAIPKLSPGEIARLRVWQDDYREDNLELTDEVKAALDEAHREISFSAAAEKFRGMLTTGPRDLSVREGSGR